MWFIFSTPVLIRHMWQLKTVVFLHRCLIHVCSIRMKQIGLFQFWHKLHQKSFIESCLKNFFCKMLLDGRTHPGDCAIKFLCRNCCCIKSVCHCHSLPRYLCRSMLEPTTVVPLPLLWQAPSVAHIYQIWVEMIGNGKNSGLHYGNNYSHKMFCSTVPWAYADLFNLHEIMRL